MFLERIAGLSALIENLFARLVIHVGVQRKADTFKLTIKFIVVHPTFLVHPNPLVPLLDPVMIKLPANILDVEAESEVYLLMLCCCLRSRNLELSRCNLPYGVLPNMPMHLYEDFVINFITIGSCGLWQEMVRCPPVCVLLFHLIDVNNSTIYIWQENKFSVAAKHAKFILSKKGPHTDCLVWSRALTSPQQQVQSLHREKLVLTTAPT
jgi:hypothetical protein